MLNLHLDYVIEWCYVHSCGGVYKVYACFGVLAIAYQFITFAFELDGFQY